MRSRNRRQRVMERPPAYHATWRITTSVARIMFEGEPRSRPFAAGAPMGSSTTNTAPPEGRLSAHSRPLCSAMML